MKGPIHCFASDLLAGKLAMVTGGGTGIGRAIAAELARSGADLIPQICPELVILNSVHKLGRVLT